MNKPHNGTVVLSLTTWVDAIHYGLVLEAGVDDSLADRMSRRILRRVLERAGPAASLSDEQRAAIAEPA